ncbi:MAG: DsbA family oxidoreductase [Acidobacteriota bacterium]
MKSVNLDIWSDIACPWCWIGKRHLAAALRDIELDVAIRWHAFELDPGAPRDVPEAYDYVARLATKYRVSTNDAEAMIARMVAAGAASGVTMRFDRVRPSNTFDAHRLLAWAGDDDLATQGRLKERLFQAYLGEGRVMADHETLIELVAEIGLDTAAAAAVLRSDRYAAAVRMDEDFAARRGIQGVPSFVIDQRALLTGAQPPDVIARALAQAAATS